MTHKFTPKFLTIPPQWGVGRTIYAFQHVYAPTCRVQTGSCIIVAQLGWNAALLSFEYTVSNLVGTFPSGCILNDGMVCAETYPRFNDVVNNYNPYPGIIVSDSITMLDSLLVQKIT